MVHSVQPPEPGAVAIGREASDHALAQLQLVQREIERAMVRASSSQIYVAHPTAMYGTRRERRFLGVIAAAFPSAEVIDPAREFSGHDEWARRWPTLLFSIDVLVVFGDRRGWIGHTTFVELVDALSAEVPVIFMDRNHASSAAAIEVAGDQERSTQRFARLVVSTETLEW